MKLYKIWLPILIAAGFSLQGFSSAAQVADSLAAVPVTDSVAVADTIAGEDTVAVAEEEIAVADSAVAEEVIAVADTAAVEDSVTVISAQELEALLEEAEQARRNYDFWASVDLYDAALAQITDSVTRVGIEEAKILSENGAGMMEFVSEPVVVAKHKFSLEDFFLYYPLEDRAWRELPNPLDTNTVNHPVVKAAYVPEGATGIFYSSPDETGARNIYRTELRDSLWSVPTLLNEAVTSSGDEIYPMFSPDGKQMYFASSGLFGMGGYDLYVSEWDEDKNEWGTPANMGFPYSSPYNDFLFVNTDDGKYSIFASDRECGPDSVYVYVLEFDAVPVRKAMDDAAALAQLCRLDPEEDLVKIDNASAVSTEISESDDTRKYMEKAAEIRALKDSIQVCSELLERDRMMFAESQDDIEREELTEEILRREAAIPALQDSLARASAQLQKIEMEFLFNGVILDPAQLMLEADRDVKGAATNYVFAKNNPGAPLEMEFEVPVEQFDYTFMILPEGRFAEDNTLPDGIVYQIQLFSLSSPAKVSQLKGLSPVFEEKTASGRYIYRAGLFRTYNDVLSNLNKVKRQGFKSAFITAFRDGTPVQVQKARVLEKTVKKTVSLYRIVITPEEGTLSETVTKAISQVCTKDIARVENGGRTEYVVGPFDDEAEMENVVVAVRAAGEDSVATEKIGEKETD